jgi:hypothetical protein
MEFCEDHKEALRYYRQSLGIWQRRLVSSRGPVRLFDGNDAVPEPFSQASLDSLMNASGAEREEILGLLRDCERMIRSADLVGTYARARYRETAPNAVDAIEDRLAATRKRLEQV